MKYFESEKTLEEFKIISPKLLYTFSALNEFCHKEKIPLRITSIVRTIDKISKSKTHQTGRALDISTKDWTKKNRLDVERFLSGWDNLHDYGARSKSDNLRRIAIFHNAGQGDHLHLQVKP